MLRSYKKYFGINFLKPEQFAGFIVITLFVVVLPLAWVFGIFSFEVFGLSIGYFYLTILGPVIVLFLINWASHMADLIDLRQQETEND